MSEETHFIKRLHKGEWYWAEIPKHPYTKAGVIKDALSGQLETLDSLWRASDGRFIPVSHTIACDALEALTEKRPPETISDIPSFITRHAPVEVQDYFAQQVGELSERRALSSREYVGTV